MRRRQLSSASIFLFYATLWIGDSVDTETCVSREASNCRKLPRNPRLKCGVFTLKMPTYNEEVPTSQSALELPSRADACTTEEAHLAEDYQVFLGESGNGSYLWKIDFQSLVGVPNATHVLFSTLKKPSPLKDRKSAVSNLRIQSYISQGVAVQFYAPRKSLLESRRSPLLHPTKANGHQMKIIFNVSGDRELDRFSLERVWLVANTTTLHCAKWAGNWTKNGCRTVSSNLCKVECVCSFDNSGSLMQVGVLTQVKSLPDSKPAMPLYVALTSASTMFFAMTLFVLIRFRRAFKDSNRRFEVQINLTVSLLLRHTFLFTGFAISLCDPLNRHACEAMGVLHAYFLITSVLWVLSEGVLVYRKVCNSSMTTPLSGLIINAVVVWGLPLLLLAAVSSYELIGDRFIQATESYTVIESRLTYIFSDSNIISKELENYRKYDFCWFTSQALALALGIPVTISLVVNTVILIWVGVVVWQKGVADLKNTPSGSGLRNAGSMRQTKSTFRAVVLLTGMLGIPWLFSLFYNIIEGIVKRDSLAPSYIHFAFVALQGPALFYLYCIHNHEFRRAFRRSIDTHNIKKDINSQVSNRST